MSREISAYHSAMRNLLAGLLTSSIVTSVYVVYVLLREGPTTPVELVACGEVVLIYYLVLLIGYKGLFLLFSDHSVFTTSVMPAVNRTNRTTKDFTLLITFVYMMMYIGLFPVYFSLGMKWYLGWFTVAICVDMLWSALVALSLGRTQTYTAPGEFLRVQRLFRTWFRLDITFFVLLLFLWSFRSIFVADLVPVIDVVVLGLLLVVYLSYVLVTTFSRAPTSVLF